MKKNLFIVLVNSIFILHSLQAIETDQKPQGKPFALCKRLKKISPDAPQSEYKKLATLWHNNNLSTCECAWDIIRKKRQKALYPLIQDNYITQEQITNIDIITERLKKKRENEKERLIIEIPEDLPEKYQQEVVNHFISNFYIEFQKYQKTQTNRSILTSNPSAEVFQIYEDSPLSTPDNPVKIPRGFRLFLPDTFQNESKLSRKATLQHEEHHALSYHNIQNELIKNEIENDLDNREFPDKEMNRLIRALELEADIIPAACGSLECAQALTESDLKDNVTDFDLARTIGGQALSNSVRQLTVLESPKITHPTTETRQKWAQRIYKLRLQEELLNESL